MNDLATRAARSLWRFRVALSAAVLVGTVIAVTSLSTLTVSNSLSVWYPENDPELRTYRAFQATYGSDEIIVVAVSGVVDFGSDDGSGPVGELTDRILDIAGVASVTSLVTVPASLAEARGRLLSEDGRTTAIVVQTLIGPDVEARRRELLQEIRQVVADLGFDAYLGGYGVVFDGLNEASTTGATSLIGGAHVIMIILLSILFRRLLPALLTLVAVGVATTWTMALYTATGHELNMVTMVLPTLVLVIGIANCVHVLRSVAAQDDSAGREAAVVTGLSDVIGPCFLMTITTAAGFLGLTVSGLPVVQQLGWFGAAGMVAAFVASMILVTAGLTWPVFEPGKHVSHLDSVALRLFDAGAGHPTGVLVAFVTLLVVSIAGIFQLSSDTDSIGYLRESHVVRQDSDFIEAEIGPYVPIEFTVTAPGTILHTAYLDTVWQWQLRVTERAEIGWSWSLISALSVAPTQLPSEVGDEDLIRRFDRLRRFSPLTAGAMIAGDRQLRISFGAPIMSARSVQRLIESIEGDALLHPDLVLEPAGYSPLYTRIVDEIVTSQINGFGAAIVLIVILIGLAMRSWHRMLLALPANAVPVVVTLGVMGWTGVPLDVASATIASVILGLVVDDSVHLLKPYPAPTMLASLRIAATRAGGTLMMTTGVLAAGFLVLGLADIRSIAWFGVLTSFAVLVAILADLTLIPALAALAKTSKKSA